MKNLSCENPGQLYKPQFAYSTPAGFRDEPYSMPFRFVVPGNGSRIEGLPHQLDDDQPFLLQAIVCPQIGTGLGAANGATPGFCRITDTKGNPLSDDLVLALGAWCQSGFSDLNAFGAVIEPAVYCEPGGTLTFDFQLTTNAGVASLTITVGLASLVFLANVFGTAGNLVSITIVNPAAANVTLSAGVVGTAVTVTLGTDGASAVTSTFDDVRDVIMGTPAVLAVMFAETSGENTDLELAPATALTLLTGGTASTPITVNGTLLGMKRFRSC